MTKSIATGPTDTAIGGFANNPQTLPALNYGVDFRIKSNVPGEVVMTNLTTPVDQPETFRFAQSKVANIYSGTEIDPSAYLPTRSGTRTLIELKQVHRESDDTDSTYGALYPMKAQIVLVLPAYGNVTADMVKTFLLRAVEGAFETGVSTSTGITALQRGVLAKKDL